MDYLVNRPIQRTILEKNQNRVAGSSLLGPFFDTIVEMEDLRRRESRRQDSAVASTARLSSHVPTGNW